MIGKTYYDGIKFYISFRHVENLVVILLGQKHIFECQK